MISKKLILISSGFIFSGFLLCEIISGQGAYDCILRAKALSMEGKDDQAIEMLSSALMVKQEGRLYSERADASFKKGNFQDALKDYNSANNLEASSGEFGLARVYAIQGDAVNSLAHLEKNLRSSLKKSEKEIMLDPAFAKIENTPEWRQFWKKDWYTEAEKSISEINYYLSAGKSNEAVTSLAELENSYPGSKQAEFGRALINLSAGKFSDVVKSVSELSGSDPGNVKYLEILAKAQSAASNPAGASDTYSKLIGMEVPDAELFMLRADCYKRTGETDKAIADINRYLSIYPEGKAAISMAGKLEAVSGDNLKAIEFFTKNLKLHPNDPGCYIDRANAYLLSKSWDWAAKDYSMSLDLDPGNSEVWLNKGIALNSFGKTDDACHDFRQSLSLGNKRASDYISRYCIK